MASSLLETGCKFCNNQQKYSCPRCNAAYCSRDCYNSKAHAECSEKFYKEMIQNELQGQGVSEDCKRKMQDILQRINNEDEQCGSEPLDSDDDEDELDLSDRIKGIDLDDTESLWKNLTKSEQEEFQTILKSGDISQLMPSWTPWWLLDHSGRPLIQEVDDDTSEQQFGSIPPILNIPPLPKNIKPAPCIPANILNVMSAYAWTARIFNGEYMESCTEATEAMFLLSPVLTSNANYEESTVAIDSVFMSAEAISWLSESQEFMKTVRGDVRALLEGPNKSSSNQYIKSALSDIISIMKSTQICLNKKKNTKKKRSNFDSKFIEASHGVELKLTTKSLIKTTIKKLEFYISYLQAEHLDMLI